MPLPFILAGAAIAAAGVGAKKAHDGYKDKSRANEILESSKRKYEVERAVFDTQSELTNNSLSKLGQLQLDIGKDFLEFRKIASDLLKKLNQERSENLEVMFPQHKLNEIDGLVLSTTAYVGKIAGAGVAGATAAYAVYGGVMAVAAASTGTPIAALSGVAAYNATMAAIGGGSLAAGGFGMAGGAMVLGGVIAAPIIAIAGWAFASHAEDALADAQKTSSEVDAIVSKMEKGRKQLSKTMDYVDSIYSETERLHNIFKIYFNELKLVNQILESDKEPRDFEERVLKAVQNGYMLASLLTELITTPLFKPKLDDQGNVVFSGDNMVELEVDTEGMQVLNESELNNSLEKVRDFECQG